MVLLCCDGVLGSFLLGLGCAIPPVRTFRVLPDSIDFRDFDVLREVDAFALREKDSFVLRERDSFVLREVEILVLREAEGSLVSFGMKLFSLGVLSSSFCFFGVTGFAGFSSTSRPPKMSSSSSSKRLPPSSFSSFLL